MLEKIVHSGKNDFFSKSFGYFIFSVKNYQIVQFFSRFCKNYNFSFLCTIHFIRPSLVFFSEQRPFSQLGGLPRAKSSKFLFSYFSNFKLQFDYHWLTTFFWNWKKDFKKLVKLEYSFFRFIFLFGWCFVFWKVLSSSPQEKTELFFRYI